MCRDSGVGKEDKGAGRVEEGGLCHGPPLPFTPATPPPTSPFPGGCVRRNTEHRPPEVDRGRKTRLEVGPGVNGAQDQSQVSTSSPTIDVRGTPMTREIYTVKV